MPPVQHVDSAQTYGNEADVGRGLQSAMESGTVGREDLFVTTKLWSDHHARNAVVPSLRESLQKLQLSYVDLFLVHWPITDQHGPTLEPPMQVGLYHEAVQEPFPVHMPWTVNAAAQLKLPVQGSGAMEH